jgi:glutathione S-transferase
MRTLIIGNKNYSSWSLRAWLACKQSGLDFEETVVPLYDDTWDVRRLADEFAPSAGKVPILWEGDSAVWDSLAIIEYLNDASGGTHFWPVENDARMFARAISAEMHTGFAALRSDYSMNICRRFSAGLPSTAVQADIDRIMQLWVLARDRYGKGGTGNNAFLLGSFGAADIMFAPVVTRFITYELPVADAVRPYMDAVMSHPWMIEWIAAAQAEEWVIDRFEAGHSS